MFNVTVIEHSRAREIVERYLQPTGFVDHDPGCRNLGADGCSCGLLEMIGFESIWGGFAQYIRPELQWEWLTYEHLSDSRFKVSEARR